MKYLKILLIVLLLASPVFAQDLGIANQPGGLDSDQANDTTNAELRALLTQVAMRQNVSATTIQLEDNFSQLDTRIQSIWDEKTNALLSFFVVIVVLNDLALIGIFFLLKLRGLL